MPKRARESAPAGRERVKRAEVLQALRGLVGLLRQSARGVEQSTGLTNAQVYILQLLAAAEPRSINDLAGAVLTQQSSVSLVVTRLEGQGLVRRARSADDARRVEVSLTPAGRRLARGAPVPPIARVLAALDTLAPRDIGALHRGLGAFVGALGLDPAEQELLFETEPVIASRPAASAVSRPRRSSPARGSGRPPS